MKIVLAVLCLSGASATPTCCYGKWGDKGTCGDYVGPSGGHCNTDPSKTCTSNSDCPASPAPAPTPPPPPKPPAPTPPPTPPSPGSLPEKVVGLYLLIADDGWPYKSETEWVPRLPDYIGEGGVNVLWLAFVHPAKMPALPPAMAYIGRHRPNGTKVIASVGGEAYSSSASWPWLASNEAAEAMAAEVVQWRTKYGIDGMDLDIEGNQPGPTALAFASKVKELDPTFIVTQAVFGSPQVTEENYMVNQCFAKGAKSAVDSIGIMVYEGTGSLQYVKGYVNGSKQWSGFPIHVDVPPQKVLLGAGGQSSAGTIETLAKAAHDQDLGGIMVWYASVIDSATGKPGNQYSGGAMDASIQSATTKAEWKKALDIMHGSSSHAIIV